MSLSLGPQPPCQIMSMDHRKFGHLGSDSARTHRRGHEYLAKRPRCLTCRSWFRVPASLCGLPRGSPAVAVGRRAFCFREPETKTGWDRRRIAKAGLLLFRGPVPPNERAAPKPWTPLMAMIVQSLVHSADCCCLRPSFTRGVAERRHAPFQKPECLAIFRPRSAP